METSFASIIVNSIIAVVIGIVVFIALRELLLWYWKIPEIIKNQKETNFLLRKMLERETGKLPEEKDELSNDVKLN